MELKLTQVARVSLEELKLDYEDFLRQRGLPQLEPQHPALRRFKSRQCKTLNDVQAWVKEEQGQARTNTDGRERTKIDTSVPVRESPRQTLPQKCLVANAALSLLNLACYFLNRQVELLAEDFENEGGFTERLYRVRTEKRKSQD